LSRDGRRQGGIRKLGWLPDRAELRKKINSLKVSFNRYRNVLAGELGPLAWKLLFSSREIDNSEGCCMETKSMSVRNTEVTLYRCDQCLYVRTWVSDPERHQDWHRQREEHERELERAMVIAAGSARN
jgi:hypothetical protein